MQKFIVCSPFGTSYVKCLTDPLPEIYLKGFSHSDISTLSKVYRIYVLENT